jgi:hypothetical protein
MNKKYTNENENNELNEIYYSNNTNIIITHLIVSFFAIYLSWRCNNKKFDPNGFILAFLCPQLYIIWALATSGGCGIFP